MTPAFAYLRVSGLTQAQEDRGGLPRQSEAIQVFATAHGYEIVKTFSEPLTGKTDWENRKAFRQMLSEIGQVKIVLIEKLDRLARDLLVQETIIADLKKRGITLVSTMEPDLCSDDPTRVLIRQILGALSQYERSMIVYRLKAGADRARSQGKSWGGRYAYGKHPKRPEEQTIIEKIQALNVQGLTLTGIAQNLNQEGFSTRSGGRWYAMHISRILEKENASH